MGNTVCYPALRAEMARAGVDQKQIAEHLGYGPSQVTKRMTGQIEWRLSELQSIALFLNVPVSSLIDEPVATTADSAVA